MSESVDRVTGVHIFPIKSCHEATVSGSLPTELNVGVTGFEYNGVADRGWVIAEADGLFVSQRGWDEEEHPKHPEDKVLASVNVDIKPGQLEVTAPDHTTLIVSLDAEQRSKSRPIRIFGNELWAFDEGNEAAHFFSELLGREVRLAKADPSKPRLLTEEFRRPEASNRVAGADGMPFLLTNQASLDEVVAISGADPEDASLSRYRGNIEIDGSVIGAFGEDFAKKLQIGDMTAFVVKACTRCPIPNIDQDTAERDNLSNKLLRGRVGWRLGNENSGKPPKPLFGQNLNHVLPQFEQRVYVGHEVSVLDSGQPNLVLKSKP